MTDDDEWVPVLELITVKQVEALERLLAIPAGPSLDFDYMADDDEEDGT